MKRFSKWIGAALVLFFGGACFFIFVMSFFNDEVGVETDFSGSAMLKSPPPGLQAPITLKVVTFNIQDTWVVGFNRPERMRAIGAKLSVLDPDVVGFQEAFVMEDLEVLKEELKGSRLTHYQYYPSGTVGSGLLLASVFPIKEVYFHRYTVSNPWWKVYEGDWWAGKGVGLGRLELPDGRGFIDFYNTHAQAGYGNPYYRDPIRVQQMTELAEFVNASRMPGSPAFVVGDLNCQVDKKDYSTAIFGANLVRLMTQDSGVDHILAVNDPDYNFEVIETVEIAERFSIRGKQLEFSDHSGWMTTVRIAPVVRIAPTATPEAVPAESAPEEAAPEASATPEATEAGGDAG